MVEGENAFCKNRELLVHFLFLEKKAGGRKRSQVSSRAVQPGPTLPSFRRAGAAEAERCRNEDPHAAGPGLTSSLPPSVLLSSCCELLPVSLQSALARSPPSASSRRRQ